ncbi:leucyl aminopeptidase, partial [Streptomyces sp. SID7803]|nr:leucyl aminopeptidase [Streptomyces sp. SID7803]
AGRCRACCARLPAGTAEAAEAVAMGALLGGLRFTDYRVPVASPVGELVIPAAPPATHEETTAGVRHGRVIAEETNRARDLINMPANHLTPDAFAAIAKDLGGERYRLDVQVLDEEALAKESFGGILGVGQGSVRPPRLVRVAYTHPEAEKTLAFVGKGITYDSGGISLKPVGFNEIMKRDMSGGAAAVLASVAAAARLRLRVNVTGCSHS